MFGVRHRPILDLYLATNRVGSLGSSQQWRVFDIGITNVGRAIAKYPGLRFEHFKDGTMTSKYTSGGFGLPVRYTDAGVTIFGGGVDHVIYPGETLKIASLQQLGRAETFPMPRIIFPKWSISVQLSAEDTETKTVERTFDESTILT